MKYNRIFLIGFRTTGKTTLGKILAESLNLSFFDMDFLIEEQAGQDVNALTKNGKDWYKFREIEHQVLEDLINADRAIISCGGGVGVNGVVEEKTKKTFGELSREILKKSKDSLVILLTSDENLIRERLKRAFQRKKIMPILNNSSVKSLTIDEKVNDSITAYKKRKKIYESIADFEIDTSSFTFPRRIVNLNIIIGDPINHSLSPQMHNSGYKKLNIDDSNLFISVRVTSNNLGKIIDAVKVLGINGVSVTGPHKEEVMKYLDKIDETAKKIGAVNTIVNDNGKLTGYNTDWIGATTALEQETNLRGKKAAVLGAGGAARAIVYGLVKKGTIVKIFNRSKEKGEKLAKEFGCDFGGIGDIEEVRDFDIIVNVTSVGMNEDKSPVDKKFLKKEHIVLDAVYSPKETSLLKDAKEKGATVVFGHEMLLYQGVEQFKMYTGLDAPVEKMRKVLENK